MREHTVPQLEAFPFFFSDGFECVKGSYDERLSSGCGYDVFNQLGAWGVFEVPQFEFARCDLYSESQQWISETHREYMKVRSPSTDNTSICHCGGYVFQ